MIYVNHFDERGRFYKLECKEGPDTQIDKHDMSYFFKRERVEKAYPYEHIGLEVSNLKEEITLAHIERILDMERTSDEM